MTVRSAILTFSLPYARSLKDKRQVARSLIDRARKRFNAAIAEVATQDQHRVLTIGVAVLSGDAGHAADMLESVLRFLEEEAEAELLRIEAD